MDQVVVQSGTNAIKVVQVLVPGVAGATGPQGLQGPVGPPGPAGPGGLLGGTLGQLIVKQSSTDGDADWVNAKDAIPYRQANVEDWRGTGGDNSDTGTLLNAIAAAKAAGGMKLSLPARFYAIDQTLLIDDSHISLIGEGAGFPRATVANQQNSPQTRITWNGPVGGTIVRFNTPATLERRIGGGIQGIQLDGNTFRAARGLVLESWVWGIFRDVVVLACSESQFRFEVVNYGLYAAQAAADTQYNLFEHCYAITTADNTAAYVNSTAIGWHLTGGSPVNQGNTSGNTFIDCHGKTSKGLTWKLENCDDNLFYWCGGGPVYNDAQYGLELGSVDQDSTSGSQPVGKQTARFNMFLGCGFGGSLATVHARSSQTGGNSSHGNQFFGLSRANAVQRPVIEPPGGGALAATLHYWDTDGNTQVKTLGLIEAVTPLPNAYAGLSQFYIDAAAGPVKTLASTGRASQLQTAAPAAFPNRDQSPAIYSRFLDGIGTPDVQVGTPSVVFSDDFSAGIGTWTNNGVAPVFQAAPWGSGQCIKCVTDSSAAQPSSYLSRSISLSKGRVIEFDFYLPQATGPIVGRQVQLFQLRSGGAYYVFQLQTTEVACQFIVSAYEIANANLHAFTSKHFPAVNTKYHLRFEMHQGVSAAAPGRILLYVDGVLALGAPWSVPDHGQSAIATMYFGQISSNINASFTVYLGNLVVSQMPVDSLASRLTGSVAGIDFVGGWAVGGAGATSTGDWTPVFSFLTPGDSVITHTVQVGKYMKVGNFVFLMLDVEFSTNAYTTAAGVAQVAGLPFASAAIEGSLTAVLSNVTFTTAQEMRLVVPASGSAIFLKMATSNAVITNVGTAAIPASKTGVRIRGTGMYWTA